MRGYIVAIALVVSSPTLGVDGVLLKQCEKQLSDCYSACKAKWNSTEKCNAQCTTDQCGLPWRESYGAFIDRRIEENAAQVPTAFVGLKRMKAAGR